MEASESVVSKRLMTFWRKQDRQGAQAYAKELQQEDGNPWEQVLRSYDALWELDDLAAQHDVPDRFRPNIWWMRGPFPGNFGDILTPYVLWHAFGIIPRWIAANRSQGLCIGSIAKFARKGTMVWGPGMPRASDPLAANAVWAAVRGPLSREAVLASGGDIPEIYGDGAVLLPEIYAPQVEKTHRIGIIPHVLQEQQLRDALEKAGKTHEVKVISLLAADFADIERVIRDIISCEEIVSTSLHGVIVSHAYGVPCQSARIIAPEEDAEDSFKMRDYKASVGLEDGPIGIPESFTDMDWLEARQCRLPPRPIDTVALRAAFPFDTPEKERRAAAEAAEAEKALRQKANAALFLARDHVRDGQHDAAKQASSDRQLQVAQPQLLLIHVAALIQSGEADAIAAFAHDAIALPVEPAIKFAMLRQLALSGHAELAASILIPQVDLRSHHAFVRVKRLILVNVSTPDLRDRLRKTIGTEGQTKVVPMQARPTEFRFQKPPAQNSWGSVRLEAAPATPAHHAAQLRAEADAFQAKMTTPRQPGVLEYHDVYTDARGQVWRTDGSFLVYRSAPVENFAPVPAASFDIAFAANRGSRGIYHWLVDYLPMFAWIMDEKAAGRPVPPILINAGNGSFERQSLDLLGLSDNIVEVVAGAPVKVERLITSRVGFRGMVGWQHLESVFSPIIERALALAKEQDVILPRRVYISRRAVPRRPMLNESHIEDHARSAGFEILDFATLPLWHQIAISHNAETIMSPHGAGLSHLIFAKPGTQVIELLPIQDGTYQLRFNYARLSILKGLDYTAWLEPQQPQINEWQVDTSRFPPFLDDLLASKVR